MREVVHEVHEPRCPASTQQVSHDVAELVLDFGQGQRAPGTRPLQPLAPMGVDRHQPRIRCQRLVRDELHAPHEVTDPWIVEPPVGILRDAGRPAVSKVAIAKGRLNLASKIEVGAGLPTIHADMDVRRTVTAATSAAARWKRWTSEAT